MIDELKPCYKCNKLKKEVIQLSDTGDSGHVEWEAWRSCDCSDISHGKTREEAIRIYNTREIEDIKDARIAELEQELTDSRRANLRQRVADMMRCISSHQGGIWAVCQHFKIPDSQTSKYIKSFTIAGGKYGTSLSGFSRDVFTDWLIEQGVEE